MLILFAASIPLVITALFVDPTSAMYEHERRVALAAVSAASSLTRRLQSQLIVQGVQSKADASPVTVADYAVQALVVHRLRAEFPNDKFIAEESSSPLRSDQALLRMISDATGLKDTDVISSISACEHGGGGEEAKTQRTWIMDPIDGTRGFIALRQYCIALGLLHHGEMQLGVLGCPNLPIHPTRVSFDSSPRSPGESDDERGVIFHAIKESGTYMIKDNIKDFTEGENMGTRCQVSDVSHTKWATFCESVESGHSSHELSARVASILNVSTPPLRMDSQAKYGCMARGDASIFLRFPKKGYVENIWDSAPASIIIEEAGGKVSDGRGRRLNFTLGRKLDNDDGIVATNGRIHEEVIEAVQQAIQENKK